MFDKCPFEADKRYECADSGGKKAETNIEVLGATLLSAMEAATLLTKEEREYAHYWWLSTPGNDDYCVCFVDYDGLVMANGYHAHFYGDVRPALIINLDSSELKVGDVFQFGNRDFKILTPSLAWMYKDDIGRQPFRKDWGFAATDYKTSDIKKFIDEWFDAWLSEYESDDSISKKTDKLTCKNCACYDTCVIMENSADDDKEKYFEEFGCDNFIDEFAKIKPGQKVYFTYKVGPSGYIIKDGTVLKTLSDNDGDWFLVRHVVSLITEAHIDQWYRKSDIGDSVFLSRDAVENYIAICKEV